MSPLPSQTKGRGARSNETSRFLTLQREAFDDGWTGDDALPRRLNTSLEPDHAKSIIASNDSPDIGFNRSINPYRGCEHGCIYCYARPAHAYLGLSPGLDFESRLFFKPHAHELLAKELSRKRYAPQVIHIGGDTDPYQPAERRARVTRRVIETLYRFKHPFTLITKSALVQRDLDILGPAAAEGLCRVAVSITTLDRKLARSMEPRAATPGRRLETVKALSAAGVPTAVMVAPVIPGLNDHELEAVLEASAQAGATSAGYVVIRLPREIASLFQQWLISDQPGRAAKVMSLIRQMRGGADYSANWGERQRGEGPIAELIASRFTAARRRFGLDGEMPPMALDLFRVPPRAGDQMDLFGEGRTVAPLPDVSARRGETANPVHAPLPVGTDPSSRKTAKRAIRDREMTGMDVEGGLAAGGLHPLGPGSPFGRPG
ncbi:MAG: PA0069 family radical SAM protein [Caulobacter sp.]|nr:PA0069 family radical SAM protein [Caulobacter sp.]